VNELICKYTQRHTVLKGNGDQCCNCVHQPRDHRTLFRHYEEDLSESTVLVHAGGDVAFGVADRELVRDSVTFIG